MVLVIALGLFLGVVFFSKYFSSSATPATNRTSPASVILNEVLFSPARGQSQFVELKRSGSDGAVLAGFSLVNEKGEKYPLPENVSKLKEGEYLLIAFDGENRLDGTTLHADRKVFLSNTSGFVKLSAPDGSIADRVAWGVKQPEAVNMGRGGLQDDFIAGTSIGRFPLSDEANNRHDWLSFSKQEVTPGGRNPNPRVEILLPLDGALFFQLSITLAWYDVAGAVRFRVQVASDKEFQKIAKEAEVEAPEFITPTLAPGEYFWRVRSVFADGTTGNDSPTNSFTISLEASASFSTFVSIAHAAAPMRERALRVPMIMQHKDTPMLCLESEKETGKHAWDKDHGTYDRRDLADRYNCALAAIAMANHFKGGDLSQDRIGYQKNKDIEPGPTQDIFYGHAASLDEISQLLTFAFNGSAVTRHLNSDLRLEQGLPTITPDDLWAVVTREIDAGRPIVTSIPGHVTLIVGYHQFAESGTNARFVSTNDPSYGRYLSNVNSMAGYITGYWVVSDMSNPRKNETGVKKDSDGDGMVDFDETERFKTDPNNPDSDDDGVKDKTEVYASVFDPNHGYTAGDHTGRDFDGDGTDMERDPDSDGGGCADGDEDTNANGKRDRNEKYNFDREDDDCGEPKLGGKITITYGFVPQRPPTCTGTVNIQLKFDLEPDWGTQPEDARKPIPPVYQAKSAFYKISSSGCSNLQGDWIWGGGDVQCNAKGAEKSGRISFGPENSSALGFWPLDPSIRLQLPQSAWLTLPIDCVYVNGDIAKSEASNLGAEALNIGSGRLCQTSEQHDHGSPPFLLDFCVKPAVCNSSELDKVDPQTVGDCFMNPQKYAVIPFKGELSKRGDVLEYGTAGATVQVEDIHVSWEVCEGCGE